MLFRLFATLACACSVALLLQIPSHADPPRVSIAVTAWDDYFFYAGFNVRDTKVVSTNLTTTSQPQQDDDVEVFFETDGVRKADIRTSDTYQMAVSAGGGAYFSVGDGSKIPKGKLVLTYKYAATVDGTLNNNSDTDIGYTVEMAVPWTELGMGGPPAAGTVWGFNAISRDRDSLTAPADKFVSLSDAVKSGADVQDPSKWTKIEFVNSATPMTSSAEIVYCPHVIKDYPIIDGVIRSGEWKTAYGFTFGDNEIAAPAPTVAEEPNTNSSPFSEAPTHMTPTEIAQATVPTTTPQNTPEPTQPPASSGYDINLPGGGTIHVGAPPPAPPPVPTFEPGPTTPTTSNHRKQGKPYRVAQGPGTSYSGNPLNPKGPPDVYSAPPVGPQLDTSGSLPMPVQTKLPHLLLAPYYYAYSPGDGLLTFHDQPMDGLGAWFGGTRSQWDLGQIRDARSAGIDVLLPVYDTSNPLCDVGLDAIVEALKEMKANGEDYPLLGVKLAATANPEQAVVRFFKHVPEQFRALIPLPDAEDNKPAVIVVVSDQVDPAAIKAAFSEAFGDSEIPLVTTTSGKDGLTIAMVSPGGIERTGELTPRLQAGEYESSWNKALDLDPDWVYVNSWNNYAEGTEVAPSRQYAEQYADATTVLSLKWRSANEWSARYLAFNVPHVIAPQRIHTAVIRVENAGTLPWRAGEGYSLSYRWYKDGRLYDDSAPHIPLTQDIYPGQSATLVVGVVAQNSYGTPIEPGDYTLVFDMIQGDQRWFSYAGDVPLKVAVHVVSATDTAPSKVTFISTTTPTALAPGKTYDINLVVRNDSLAPIAAGEYHLVAKLAGSEAAVSDQPITTAIESGSAGAIAATLTLPMDAVRPGNEAQIIWSLGDLGSMQETALVIHDIPQGSFSLSEVPRHVKTGDSVKLSLGVVNYGPSAWDKSTVKIGYRWDYLDGVKNTDSAGVVSLSEDVPVGHGSVVEASIRAPQYPGRYVLLFYLLSSDSDSSGLSAPITLHNSIYMPQVWVEPGSAAVAVPVDLSREFDSTGVGFEGGSTGDFDGHGSAIPGEMLPPDGAGEIDANPLLIGKPGPALYPSGYYSKASGEGWASNHRISFLFGQKTAPANTIACKGQSIALPEGNYKSIHVLGASTSADGAAQTRDLTLEYGGDTQPAALTMDDWGSPPSAPGSTVGYDCKYRLTQQDGTLKVDLSKPTYLGDYTIAINPGKRLRGIRLPSNADMKILAITLER